MEQNPIPISIEAQTTMRDYFAARALQGFIAYGYNADQAEAVAKSCYCLADAMLKERAKPEI